jgi:hypothetical protein
VAQSRVLTFDDPHFLIVSLICVASEPDELTQSVDCTLTQSVWLPNLSESFSKNVLKGTIAGVLQMLEDAVISETTSFAKTGGTHQAHNGFA